MLYQGRRLRVTFKLGDAAANDLGLKNAADQDMKERDGGHR